MTEQENHTNRDQKLKTDIERVRELDKEGTELLQRFLNWINESNKEGFYIDWRPIALPGGMPSAAQVKAYVDPEARKYA